MTSSFNLFSDDTQNNAGGDAVKVGIVFIGKAGSGKSSLANAFLEGRIDD